MPKLADVPEEDFVKKLNNLEARIKELEKSVCRCGLGLKEGGEKETDEKGSTEDESKKNGTGRKNKRMEGKESDIEDTTRNE